MWVKSVVFNLMFKDGKKSRLTVWCKVKSRELPKGNEHHKDLDTHWHGHVLCSCKNKNQKDFYFL